jgi:hypothetical protein
MQVEARMTHEPVLDRLGVVGGVVVTDEVHVQRGRHGLVDGAQDTLVRMCGDDRVGVRMAERRVRGRLWLRWVDLAVGAALPSGMV